MQCVVQSRRFTTVCKTRVKASTILDRNRRKHRRAWIIRLFDARGIGDIFFPLPFPLPSSLSFSLRPSTPSHCRPHSQTRRVSTCTLRISALWSCDVLLWLPSVHICFTDLSSILATISLSLSFLFHYCLVLVTSDFVAILLLSVVQSYLWHLVPDLSLRLFISDITLLLLYTPF